MPAVNDHAKYCDAAGHLRDNTSPETRLLSVQETHMAAGLLGHGSNGRNSDAILRARLPDSPYDLPDKGVGRP